MIRFNLGVHFLCAIIVYCTHVKHLDVPFIKLSFA